jgi:ComF family protein
MRIVPLEGTLCSICGERILGQHFATNAGPLCGACRLAAPRFRKAVAFGAYEGALRDLVHIFKYQGVRSAAPLLGRLLEQAVSRIEIEEPLLVVPVPLWPGKRRTRGFNQAEEIARAFWRCRASSSIQLSATLLLRTRETTSQTGLTRRQRQANLRGAFALVKPERLRGKSILLVDDVMTTGATGGECTRVLLRAGAKQVFVATVARATRQAESVLSVATAASQETSLRATGFEPGGTTGHA